VPFGNMGGAEGYVESRYTTMAKESEMYDQWMDRVICMAGRLQKGVPSCLVDVVDMPCLMQWGAISGNYRHLIF